MTAKNPARQFDLSLDEESISSSTENPVPASAPSTLLEEGQLLSQSQDTTPAVTKPKIARTRFTIYQKVALENSFLSSLYLTAVERDALAFKLGLSPDIVQTWFKNRRFKWRKEFKMANGTRPEPRMPPSPLLLLPNTPPLTYRESYVGPELQQHAWEGSLCQCCPNSAPGMFRNNNNTHW